MEQGSLWTLYSDVKASPVNWLWYPYIAVGKITILEGDPEDGKSTMMMNLISEFSKGGVMPDGVALGCPIRVVYQCSEDGSKDTIKPRLEAVGADCRNVAFIDEEVHEGLTLDDERIRQVIEGFHAKLVVIDPIQAYIGNDSDLQIAARARRLMRRLGKWAAIYNCAVVLIGHLNKSDSRKDLYRSLGSIDVMAAARSVLLVERDADDEDIRIVRQVKNNLAPKGPNLRFEIRRETGFRWLINERPALQKRSDQMTPPPLPKNKHELCAILIRKELEHGDVEARRIREVLNEYRIGEKTMNETKAELGVTSYRKMRQWYWHMNRPGEEEHHERI